MFDFDTFEKSLKTTFDKLTKSQAEALSIEIAANFTAGMSAAETHKSFKSEEPEEDGLTNKEKSEISALAALYLGYISKIQRYRSGSDSYKSKRYTRRRRFKTGCQKVS